jgi:hypothetical protein
MFNQILILLLLYVPSVRIHFHLKLYSLTMFLLHILCFLGNWLQLGMIIHVISHLIPFLSQSLLNLVLKMNGNLFCHYCCLFPLILVDFRLCFYKFDNFFIFVSPHLINYKMCDFLILSLVLIILEFDSELGLGSLFVSSGPDFDVSFGILNPFIEPADEHSYTNNDVFNKYKEKEERNSLPFEIFTLDKYSFVSVVSVIFNHNLNNDTKARDDLKYSNESRTYSKCQLRHRSLVLLDLLIDDPMLKQIE